MKLNIVDIIALVLVIVGGINWGLGAFGYNLVTAILGSMGGLVQVVYALVGIAAIYLAVVFPKLERR